MMEPEPKIFEFPFNRRILYSKPTVQIMQWFLVFNAPNCSGAGAKNFGAGARARNLSFGSTVLVPTTANLAPSFYLKVF